MQVTFQHFCDMDKRGLEMSIAKGGKKQSWKWKNDPAELTEEGFCKKGSPPGCIMTMEQIVYGQTTTD
jgi:hypothetical protein